MQSKRDMLRDHTAAKYVLLLFQFGGTRHFPPAPALLRYVKTLLFTCCSKTRVLLLVLRVLLLLLLLLLLLGQGVIKVDDLTPQPPLAAAPRRPLIE
jgi:hypothetical protein